MPAKNNETQDLSHLSRLLALEATYRLRPETMEEFLAGGTLIALDTYEPMIDAGVFDPNIYIVKTGLIRGTYLDKNTEKTAGFALPGTVLMSFHCYYGHEPSYYRFEACCPTTLLRVPRQYFDEMLERSHEFSLWIMSMHQNQLYYNESRNRLLSGDAKTRLIQLTRYMSGNADIIEAPDEVTDGDNIHRALVRNGLYTRWKEIFRLVPSKIIASYLGITEQHLSKIKREVLLGDLG